MFRYKKSIELIIFLPILAFLILSGAGLYFLILSSFEKFTQDTIRQNFDSMFSGIHSIADRKVDQMNKSGQAANERLVRIGQVSVLVEIEDFARKNDVGVVIYDMDREDAILVTEISETAKSVVSRDSEFQGQVISLDDDERYYADSFEFTPWKWHITLLKNSAAYDDLIAKTHLFYTGAGVALLLISGILAIYLRRTIARPIQLIVGRFKAGETPDYTGIREFEFLSENIGRMMLEVSEYRDHLEEQVTERTAELQEKNIILESLSSQLSKYLSPQVYASIFSGAQSVEVTSKRKKLTIFFSDIDGFTQTADRLESEELTQLLNHYLTEMAQIALEYGGTIDKYVGDAILIFFGDPETKGVKEDALTCIHMAIAMRRRMAELQDLWSQSGIERPLTCRMGVHTGFCTVGNFGSEDRMDYTIIGGAVNTASRLEAIATPGEILISYDTFAHVRDQIYCEEHGETQVKGIAYPVATYRVVDFLPGS